MYFYGAPHTDCIENIGSSQNFVQATGSVVIVAGFKGISKALKALLSLNALIITPLSS